VHYRQLEGLSNTFLMLHFAAGAACHRNAAGADASSTAAYLSRFIHRLISRISDPLFTSRASSPTLGGRNMHGLSQSIAPESPTAAAGAIDFDASVNLVRSFNVGSRRFDTARSYVVTMCRTNFRRIKQYRIMMIWHFGRRPFRE
jgi:hypothetical protein